MSKNRDIERDKQHKFIKKKRKKGGEKEKKFNLSKDSVKKRERKRERDWERKVKIINKRIFIMKNLFIRKL